MTFTFETEYNQQAIRTMAEGLRRTIRKKRNSRTHIVGWIVVAAAILLTLPVLKGEEAIGVSTVINWLTAAGVTFVLLFEDAINGYAARKRMLVGNDRSTTVFEEDSYTSTTEIGKSEFSYANIRMVAENEDYFVFIYDQSHAQVYDKSRMTGGTVEEFRAFISAKTGSAVIDFGNGRSQQDET